MNKFPLNYSIVCLSKYRNVRIYWSVKSLGMGSATRFWYSETTFLFTFKFRQNTATRKQIATNNGIRTGTLGGLGLLRRLAIGFYGDWRLALR
jgi:hypothetical protein